MSAWVTAEQLASFMARIERVPGPMPEPCWLWTGYIGHNGYARFRVAAKATRSTGKAHRFAYAVAAGEAIPFKAWVLHTCHVRRCVHPAHLYLGDAAQNSKDMIAAGNSNRGEKNARAKLAAHHVRAIRFRLAAGEAVAVIAREFRVTRATIYHIGAGDRWGHVK